MRTRAAVVLCAVGCVVGAGAPGAAVQPQAGADDLRELVMGLVHSPWELAGRGDPELLVGASPAGSAARLYVPADATVHGSLAYENGSVTLVATLARSAEELWPEYQREMSARGWRPSEHSTEETRSVGDVALAWVFCGEGLEAALVSVSGGDHGTRLRIDRHPEYRSWHCMPRAELAAAVDRQARAPYQLAPPPYSGDSSIGACRAATRAGAGSLGGAVPSMLSLEELRAHYESQLDAKGWARVPEAGEPTRLLSVWSRGESSAVLVLAAVPGLPHCWHVTFAMAGPGDEAPR